MQGDTIAKFVCYTTCKLSVRRPRYCIWKKKWQFAASPFTLSIIPKNPADYIMNGNKCHPHSWNHCESQLYESNLLHLCSKWRHNASWSVLYMRAQHENRQARDDPWVQKKVNFYCTPLILERKLTVVSGVVWFVQEGSSILQMD